MLFMMWILALLALIFGIVPFFLTFKFRHYCRREIKEALTTRYAPKVSLIVPCKGTDHNFDEHILSFLTQDYPDYEVIFVTATYEDPAYRKIQNILNSYQGKITSQLLVAGIEEGRGQKMTNMLKGLKHVSADTEVFAFMDADIDIYPQLLQKLVQPLYDDNVGAASGIWVFLPLQKAFGSILKFVWSSGAVLMAPDKKNNLAIAAVTCIKKSVFEEAGIAKRLEKTVSDTMAFTQGIRSLGLSVHFVPSAMIISEDKSSVKDVLDWTNRLATFNRVYNRPFWWKVFLIYSTQNLLIIAGLATLLAVWLGADQRLLLPGAFMAGLMVLQVLHAFVTFPILVNRLNKYPQAQRELRKMTWKICLSAPLGGVITMINSLHSLVTNIVTWRGVSYQLISPTETKVLGEVK